MPPGKRLTATQRIQRRRKKLWEDDPHCRKCKVLTILPEHLAVMYNVDRRRVDVLIPSDAREVQATLEHRFTKLQPERTTEQGGETTLFCYRCNHQSGIEVYRKMQKQGLFIQDTQLRNITFKAGRGECLS